MGLAAQQRLLAALYTKGSARRAFFASREPFARSFGLEDADRPFWEGLDADQVGRFARSLIAKRFGEVARLIPGTIALLGGQPARRAFGDYAEEVATEGHRRHLADALGFLDRLEGPGAIPDGAPAWLRDVIRLERLRLRAAPPGWRLVGALLGHDLRGWSPPEAPPRCRVLVLGVRPGRRPFRGTWLRLGRARSVS